MSVLEREPTLEWHAAQRLGAYRAAYSRWSRDGSEAERLTVLENEILDLLTEALAARGAPPRKASVDGAA